MTENENFLNYSFNVKEIKHLSVLLKKQNLPQELKQFEKSLFAALLQNISLEEAEQLFRAAEIR